MEAFSFGYPLGDIRGLLADCREDCAGIGIESQLGAGIADSASDLACYIGIINLRTSSDLASDDDHPGFGQRLASNPTLRILFEERVQDPIRDLIAHLVWMALGYRLRGKQKIFCRHGHISLSTQLPPCGGSRAHIIESRSQRQGAGDAQQLQVSVLCTSKESSCGNSSGGPSDCPAGVRFAEKPLVEPWANLRKRHGRTLLRNA